MASILVMFICTYLLYRLLDYFLRSNRLRSVDTKCIGKYVLITGCDSGFGEGLAKRLDGKGCNVFATCLTAEGARKLKKTSSNRLKTIIMDVAKESSVADAYQYVKDQLPEGSGLTGIVNNAGFAGSAAGPLEWLTLQNFREIMEVNFFGLVNVTMTFLPLVKKIPGRVGRIVNTASVHGRTCLDACVPYSCSKYGVEAFSDGLRRQMKLYGISVHLIEPGFHKTNIINKEYNEKQLRNAWKQASPEIKHVYGEEYVDDAINSHLNKLLPMIASDKLENVIDAYEHALFGLYPRARYVIGIDANFFWLPVQWLPEWIGDSILTATTPKIKNPPIQFNK